LAVLGSDLGEDRARFLVERVLLRDPCLDEALVGVSSLVAVPYRRRCRVSAGCDR
jgi:hypothetical protein